MVISALILISAFIDFDNFAAVERTGQFGLDQENMVFSSYEHREAVEQCVVAEMPSAFCLGFSSLYIISHADLSFFRPGRSQNISVDEISFSLVERSSGYFLQCAEVYSYELTPERDDDIRWPLLYGVTTDFRLAYLRYVELGVTYINMDLCAD
jgi:hypothetical protein